MTRCPALAPLAGSAPARTESVDIAGMPAALRDSLRKMTASTRDQFAVATLGGGLDCIDIRRMITIGGVKPHQRDRFVSFAWEGFEENGYRSDGTILVDRAGAGKHVDTGGEPVFSPSGTLIAAVHQSPTAFSALQGFGLWQAGPYGTVQVTKIEDLPEMFDWRIDRWESEACVSLSAVPFARLQAGSGDIAALPRDRFIVRRSEAGWAFAPAAKGGC
ncbi:hypothetical protein [Novosphingobium album (ex Liu et al. 2023)]|uniref:Uncharacterized protein n=1 Tax=Novosphingobium album (ex Liu et al. 2023) TaxID=3031130 RepID=A0ABT5WUZ0_9SPHN|nr:hypothetical protein [Novosphingobium album (ex Liu et al. 2023)]MDE8653718.1 hypothetical protein [Novosphingobium album (ex Liu et al. 2023)]